MSDFDDDDVTHSPVFLSWGGFLAVLLSGYLLLFVGRRTNLDGSQIANLVGWIIGAFVIPGLVVTYRHVEFTRRETSFNHIPSRIAQQAIKWELMLGILLAAIHGAAYALEMR